MEKLLRKKMEDYKGLHCGCAPGTHAALVDMILNHMKPCAGVLDVGAHSGALLSRLKDADFTDMQGTDLDLTRFNLPGVSILRLDLNQEFSKEFTRKFSLITSTEVIEHLDSPRNFLQEVRKILNDDGYLAISLPNVAFWEGRIKFLLKGELWGFGEKNYRFQRHISPITDEQMLVMMEEIGFRVVEFGSAGSFATPLRWLITGPLWIPIRIFGGKRVLGESAIFLAKKAPPNTQLSSPMDYRDRWKASDEIVGVES